MGRLLRVVLFIGFAWVWGNTGFSQNRFADWNQTSDWQPAHDVSRLQKTDAGILISCVDSDPYIISKATAFPAAQYSAILVEMKVDSGSQAQVFWARKDDPNFTEGKSHRIILNADGSFHTYSLILSRNPEWTGEIVRLRLDPSDARASVTLRSFRIVDCIGPIIQSISFYPGAPCANPGKPIDLTARFRNDGDRPGTVAVSLNGISNRWTVLKNPDERLTISPGEEIDVRWTLSANVECAEPVACIWQSVEKTSMNTEGGQMQAIVQSTHIDPPVEASVLDWADTRITVCRSELGYGALLFSIKKENAFEPAAMISRLGTVKIEHNDGSIGVYPVFQQFSQTQVAEEKPSPDLSFHSEWNDSDGRAWNFSLDIQKQDALPGAFYFTYTLNSDGGRLLHFSGPELYVGEGSFGRKKDGAVFPGVEYLDRDAVSSSDAVANPPVRDQFIPHPYKNTIPFMSLTNDGVMVSLLWPAISMQDGDGYSLSPVFAVPNRLYGQNNHLFGLFVPNVPDFTRENRDTAYTPLVVKPHNPVRIQCTIYLAKSNDPNDALDAWLKVYGNNRLPDVISAPRSYFEEIQLSRQAYLRSCWDEKALGWGHCVGWKASPSGGMLALLDIDSFLNAGGGDRETARQRVKQVYDFIISQSGSVGLASSAGCHVMNFEPAFYWGVTESALSGWLRQAAAMKQSQNADGSWGFHPGNKDQATLGKDGEVVSGTISPNAMYLMRLARIAADPIATETGLKAVEALNRETVPRGAQGWECPLAAADILVSGQGARANLDAYRVTGEEKYLEKAVYWARSGIVFHYLWNREDRPLQRYACIPIFGTTFFSHSWLGVPVQWCGLVYAYALQDLAEFDDSYPWRIVARGIVNSAMLQQVTEGTNIGTLPDSYGDYFLTARGAWINPENIMTNLHALEGNSLNIQTVFPDRVGVNALRVSANAKIYNALISEKQLTFSAASKRGRRIEILLAPVERAPREVWIESNNPLPLADSLFEKNAAWRYLADFKALLIHCKQDEENVSLRIEFD